MFTIRSKTKLNEIFTSPKIHHVPKYTVCKKTIRFSEKFNEKMDSYYWIIKDMNVLIFEDRLCITSHSKFKHPITLHRFIVQVAFGSGFNRHVILTSNVRRVEFGCGFNKSIILAKKIESLTFGDGFNKPIVLSPNIQYLSFGSNFDQPIFLTKKITHVTFGTKFNQPIILSAKIKYLHFGQNFNQSIVLTHQITDVIFGLNFNKPIVLLPNIKCLKIQSANYWLIDGLTDWMDNLNLGYSFDEPLYNMPNSITAVYIADSKYKYEHLIPKEIIW